MDCSRLSMAMEERWASREGVSWGRTPGVGPYFYYCELHHMLVWPEDKRFNNKCSQPGSSGWMRAEANGVTRRIAGDLYINTPPLEVMGTLLDQP